MAANFDLVGILQLVRGRESRDRQLVSSANFDLAGSGVPSDSARAADNSTIGQLNRSYRPSASRNPSVSTEETTSTGEDCFSKVSSLQTATTLSSLGSAVTQDLQTLTSIASSVDQEIPVSTPMPCDCSQYTGCTQTFWLPSEWISHCLDHYGTNLPEASLCWFCDTQMFQAPDSRFETRQVYFEGRLRHISSHYLNGTHSSAIRPDYYVLKHLYSTGVISERTFTRLNVHENEWLGTWEEQNLSRERTQPTAAWNVEIAGRDNRVRRQSRRANPGL
jgi:hypothetical protein